MPLSIRDKDSFAVYRGGGEDINKAAYSLSWTLSQEMAEWFMKRHELTNPAPQHLYKGIISAERVIAYINDRKEFEIVQYRGVKKIEEISPEGFSQDFEGLKKHEVLHSESENAWDNYFDKWYSGHICQSTYPFILLPTVPFIFIGNADIIFSESGVWNIFRGQLFVPSTSDPSNLIILQS